MESQDVHRKMLAAAVSTVLLESGFDSADKVCLGTFTEMMQAFISEVGNLSRNYCELSGRSEPIIGDIILAFVEMGYDFSSLSNFIKGPKHHVLPNLQPQQPQKQLNMLSAGTKQALPSHIPQYFPQFPDPHAYVRTPTHKQPIIDYESVREKAAVQKKDIEKALTKFLAKTSQINNLFDNDEAHTFPLIACQPSFPPYLSALLPQDQIFDTEDLEYDPKTQLMQQAKEHKEKNSKPAEKDEDDEETNEMQNESLKQEETTASIDNPYLAATKLPGKDPMDLS